MPKKEPFEQQGFEIKWLKKFYAMLGGLCREGKSDTPL